MNIIKYKLVTQFTTVSFPTCSFLKGRDGLHQTCYCLPVTAGTDLRVEGRQVEEDAGFLQGHILLAHWHSCEGVIPEAKKREL